MRISMWIKRSMALLLWALHRPILVESLLTLSSMTVTLSPFLMAAHWRRWQQMESRGQATCRNTRSVMQACNGTMWQILALWTGWGLPVFPISGSYGQGSTKICLPDNTPSKSPTVRFYSIFRLRCEWIWSGEVLRVIDIKRIRIKKSFPVCHVPSDGISVSCGGRGLLGQKTEKTEISVMIFMMRVGNIK